MSTRGLFLSSGCAFGDVGTDPATQRSSGGDDQAIHNQQPSKTVHLLQAALGGSGGGGCCEGAVVVAVSKRLLEMSFAAGLPRNIEGWQAPIHRQGYPAHEGVRLCPPCLPRRTLEAAPRLRHPKHSTGLWRTAPAAMDNTRCLRG